MALIFLFCISCTLSQVSFGETECLFGDILVTLHYRYAWSGWVEVLECAGIMEKREEEDWKWWEKRGEHGIGDEEARNTRWEDNKGKRHLNSKSPLSHGSHHTGIQVWFQHPKSLLKEVQTLLKHKAFWWSHSVHRKSRGSQWLTGGSGTAIGLLGRDQGS